MFKQSLIILFVTSLGLNLSAQSWSLTGNSSTDPTVNFIGTTDLLPLTFKTNNQEQVRLLSNGNMLLGTTTDAGFRLDVNGKFRSSADAVINGITVGKGGSSNFYNTAVGYIALSSNSSGTSNIAIGYGALRSNTWGNYNTAIGADALALNQTSTSNTAVGYSSQQYTMTGYGNTSVGANSLQNNLSGIANSAFGYIAMVYNNSGSHNSAYGYVALNRNTIGNYNTAQGSYSLSANTTGHDNTALGTSTMLNSIEGSYNVAIGSYTASQLKAGNSNILIGSYIQANISDSASNQLNIGNWIYGYNGNIGIGVCDPTAKLHTIGSVRFQDLDKDSSRTRLLVTDSIGNLAYRDISTLSTASSQWTATGNNLYNNNAGIVTIGTSSNPNPSDVNLKLAVNGTIYSKRIKVTMTGWADYVFENDYKLPTLTEVEQFIKKYKHLPDIPSAIEVEKNGLDLGDNQALLLRKIEELTLYVIDLKSQNEEIKMQNNDLKQRIEKLESK